MATRPVSTALVTGITGQDGWYLARHLVTLGSHVIGISRRPPAEVLPDGVTAYQVNAGDASSVRELLASVRPDEVYHLAAETSVERSWDDPAGARASAQGGGPAFLAAVRDVVPEARLVVAASAEVFSAGAATPQDEDTPLTPGSPYGEGKAALIVATRDHRAREGRHASVAVLYNHESPRRSPRFVSRKITMAVAAIAAGQERELRLGALDVRRDWGFAGDYVDALVRMARADDPGDFVVGTGVSRTVAELCEVAFGAAGLPWREHVVSDPAFVRPVDTSHLVANPRRIRSRLGWAPSMPFPAMIAAMVEADIERLRHHR